MKDQFKEGKNKKWTEESKKGRKEEKKENK